jgi:hypothetical protein
MFRYLTLVAALLLALTPITATGQENIVPPVGPEPGGSAPGLNNGNQWVAPGSQAGRVPYDDERWILRIQPRAGYTWMRYNANFSMESDPRNLRFSIEQKDLDVKDMNYWVGFIGLQLQPAPGFVLYGNAGGNLTRKSTVEVNGAGKLFRPAAPIFYTAADNVGLPAFAVNLANGSVFTVDTDQAGFFLPQGTTGTIGGAPFVIPDAADPLGLNALAEFGGLSGANMVPPWFWDTEFNWWMMEVGAMFQIIPEIAIEAGFRSEHVDFRMRNPRNLTAEAFGRRSPAPILNDPQFASVRSQLLDGGISCNRICPSGVGWLMDDPIAKTYVPYIGIRGNCRKCCGCSNALVARWRIIGSPFVWNNFRDPMDVHCQSRQNPALVEIHRVMHELQGSAGGFVEGECEGLVEITGNLRGTGWLNASWLEVTGKGQITQTVQRTQPDIQPFQAIPPDTPTVLNVARGSADADNSRVTRSWFAMGLGVELSL